MLTYFSCKKHTALEILKISGENNGRPKCSSRMAAIVAEALVRDSLDFKEHSIKVDSQAPCKRTQLCSPTTPNIVGCYMLRPLVHPRCCCCAKFKTGQTFQPTTPNISFVPWSPKRSATMLDPFAQLFQHCWGRARSLRMVYKDLWVVSFPRCTAGPNIVGSCCIRLHAALVEKTSIEGLTVIFVYVIDYSWNCKTMSFEKTCGVSSCTHL